MSEPTPYAQLLKDPRWQRKRLEILERDNWTCQFCDATDKNLQVDHLKYRWGQPPWVVENKDLQTLCDECHSRLTKLRRQLRSAIPVMTLVDLDQVVAYAAGLALARQDEAARVTVENYEQALGIGDAFGLPARVVVGWVIENGGTISERELRDLQDRSSPWDSSPAQRD